MMKELITTNISTGNQELFQDVIVLLQQELENGGDNDGIIEDLIVILNDNQLRIEYVNMKSILIIVNTFKQYFTNIKVSKSIIQQLVLNINNMFLEEDFNLDLGLEKYILSGESSINEKGYLYKFFDNFKDILYSLSISGDTQVLESQEIIKYLEKEFENHFIKLKQVV